MTLVEKNSITSIERITGHHKDTIGHLIEDLALHAEMLNSILPQDVELGQFKAYVMIECVFFSYSKTAASSDFKGLTDDA